jgi:hypothetical protein
VYTALSRASICLKCRCCFPTTASAFSPLPRTAPQHPLAPIPGKGHVCHCYVPIFSLANFAKNFSHCYVLMSGPMLMHTSSHVCTRGSLSLLRVNVWPHVHAHIQPCLHAWFLLLAAWLSLAWPLAKDGTSVNHFPIRRRHVTAAANQDSHSYESNKSTQNGKWNLLLQ